MPEADGPASRLVAEAIALAGGIRGRIGSEHWPLPDFSALNYACVEDNHIFWATQKPELKINGTGNVIVLGSIAAGGLKGNLLGSGNIVLAAGETSRFGLRIDIHGDAALLYIGPGTRIISAHIVLGRSETPTSVLIGAQSLLSRLVTLRATDSHSIIDIASAAVINEPADIVVEPHVWIGENATLLKGCWVGAGSIIAAGALVTGALPACATCGGIPAKVLRTGTTWTASPLPSPRQIRATLDFLQGMAVPAGAAAAGPADLATGGRAGVVQRLRRLFTGKNVLF